mmetsp:Transcript_32276/g.68755  ORF Transcript_32276/g.68755 Transcript_32276/m.68755 type:complete len:526 (-) Transcript_32276:216-1793(-)
MKLLSRKKSDASPKASKAKSFRRSITPKKMRNDDGEGETAKSRRSFSKRFSMRSSRKSKQKTSPPELISPVAVDETDAHQEPEAEKEAEATKEEEAPEEETLKEEAPEVESAKEEVVEAIQEEEEGAEPAEEGAKEEGAKDEEVKEKEVQETSEADEPGKSHGFFKKMSFRKSKRGGSSSRGSPVSYASSQGSAARATPPLEAPQEAMQEEADDVAAEKVEEEAKPEEDEAKEEEAALAEEGEAASTKEEEEEEQDEAAEGGEDAASAKEEEESASANEEEEVAPTAEEASLEEEAPKEKSRAVAKEETETVDDYSYDQDLSMEPSIETVEHKDTVVLGFFQAAPPQPRGEESVFDVGMHNVQLALDNAMTQAMTLGAQGAELLNCGCADTTVEDTIENNATDLVSTGPRALLPPSSSDADPNGQRQSVFLQPEMLDKAKDLWEQARTSMEETYTEASSSWLNDSNTYSTLVSKARLDRGGPPNDGGALPTDCITEDTEDDTRGEESEGPAGDLSFVSEEVRQEG